MVVAVLEPFYKVCVSSSSGIFVSIPSSIHVQEGRRGGYSHLKKNAQISPPPLLKRLEKLDRMDFEIPSNHF